jgi:hypothetical protein
MTRSLVYGIDASFEQAACPAMLLDAKDDMALQDR